MKKQAQSNRKRDRKLDALAQKQGWTVVRIWEHDVDRGYYQVLEAVL